MKKLLLILFIIGCGKDSLKIVPERVQIDAPESIQVEHRVVIDWEFVTEYCDNVGATNQELEDCIQRMTDLLKEML